MFSIYIYPNVKKCILYNLTVHFRQNNIKINKNIVYIKIELLLNLQCINIVIHIIDIGFYKLKCKFFVKCIFRNILQLFQNWFLKGIESIFLIVD